MDERTNITYRVVITAIDGETGDETERLNDTFKSLLLTGDTADGEAVSEIAFNESLGNIAANLCVGSITNKAVRLANLMLKKAENAKRIEAEDRLIELIGGIN